jgi:hypothetical protein
MTDQLWWLNRPLCLEWREEADETPNAFRWLVEVVYGMCDALAPRRASDLRTDRQDARTRPGIASGRGWRASTHRRNV